MNLAKKLFPHKKFIIVCIILTLIFPIFISSLLNLPHISLGEIESIPNSFGSLTASGSTEVLTPESNYDSFKPSADIDNEGNIHLVYYEGVGGPSTRDVFYKVWNATTKNWSSSLELSDVGSAGSMYSELEVDNEGNVHVVWDDDNFGTYWDVVYRMWNATTNAWSSIYVLSTSTYSAREAKLAIDTNGDVHVAWSQYEETGTIPDIQYRWKNATTGAWSSVETPYGDAGVTNIVVDIDTDYDNNVHLVWYETSSNNASGSDQDIFYIFKNSSADKWESMDVVSSESDSFSNFTRIVVDQNGYPHVVWQDMSDYDSAGTDADIFYKYKNMSSGTWTTTEVVSRQSTNDSTIPYMDLDAFGNPYVTWGDFTDISGSVGIDSDVFFSRKLSSSSEWSSMQLISDASTGDSYLVWIVFDNYDFIHFFWSDRTNYQNSGTDIDVFYKNITLKWFASSTHVISTESSIYCGTPSFEVDNNGNIHVVYFEDSSPYREVYYKCWNVTTETWSDRELLSTGIFHAYVCELAVDSKGNIHVVWDQDGPYWDVVYRMRNATTNTWESIVGLKTATYSAWEGRIVIDTADNVHVAWSQYEETGTIPDIQYRWKNATSGAWSSVETPYGDAGITNMIVDIDTDNNNNIHLVWHEISSNNASGSDMDIFYSFRNASSSQWNGIQLVSSESDAGSNFSRIAVDSKGNPHVIWQDISDYDSAGTDFDIFYKYKNMSTGIWTITQVLSSGSTGSSIQPFISIDNKDDIQTVWCDDMDVFGGGSDFDIFYKYWSNDTKIWDPWELLSTNSNQSAYSARITKDKFDNVYTIWMDNTNFEDSGSDTDIVYKLAGSSHIPRNISYLNAINKENGIYEAYFEITDRQNQRVEIENIEIEFTPISGKINWTQIQVNSNKSGILTIVFDVLLPDDVIINATNDIYNISIEFTFLMDYHLNITCINEINLGNGIYNLFYKINNSYGENVEGVIINFEIISENANWTLSSGISDASGIIEIMVRAIWPGNVIINAINSSYNLQFQHVLITDYQLNLSLINTIYLGNLTYEINLKVNNSYGEDLEDAIINFEVVIGFANWTTIQEISNSSGIIRLIIQVYSGIVKINATNSSLDVSLDFTVGIVNNPPFPIIIIIIIICIIIGSISVVVPISMIYLKKRKTSKNEKNKKIFSKKKKVKTDKEFEEGIKKRMVLFREQEVKETENITSLSQLPQNLTIISEDILGRLEKLKMTISEKMELLKELLMLPPEIRLEIIEEIEGTKEI
ncbi:MAG: hypothetical protein EAX96_10700 [Candidatus Lokiarchaeota archaeon]|nr:hypothetical protein [Candidatus Lokiarchaeota archaeon]